ncbi:MAG: DUF1501 domain-containing protein [Pseudomonadota bacterium]
MKINRRDFLKYSSSALAALSLPSIWIPKSARASGTAQKKLVIFFLDGGNDGQNTIVPIRTYNSNGIEIQDINGTEWHPDDPQYPPFSGPNSHSQYDHYRALRPTIHLRKTQDGDNMPLLPLNVWNGGPSLGNRMTLDGSVSQGFVEFGLHPGMQSLVDIWNDGDLAIFPAAHCGPDSNRSHFFQTEYFGHGLYQTNEGDETNGDGRGWVGRYFDQKYLPGGIVPERIEAFDFESGYYPLMDGSIPILAVGNPSDVLDNNEEELLEDVVNVNTARGETPDNLRGLYAQSQQALANKLAKIDGVNFPSNVNDYNNNFKPDGDLDYPNTGLGHKFMRTAAMIKDPTVGPEIEVFNLEQGGFDLHGNQVTSGNSSIGNHNNRLTDVANSMKAFYDDLNSAGCGEDVITVVMTEFGRTSDENGARGTDHARASCWFAMGPGVNPGLYGTYPGTARDVLNPNFGQPDEPERITDLDGGGRKYLFERVDYRDILSEVIANHLNNPATSSIDAAAPFNPAGYGSGGNGAEYSLPTNPLNFVGTVHS